MPPRPFPVNTELTAVAIGYQNRQLIADEVLPRIPVGTQNFSHLVYDPQSGLNVPNTSVSRTGQVNTVNIEAEEVANKTEDRGLQDGVPYDDIENAKDGYDPLGQTVENLTNLIKLDREVKTASLVFSASNYTSDNTLIVTDAKEKISDYVNSSPIDMICDYLDKPLLRPTLMVIGGAAFSKLARHPHIIQAILGTSCEKGIASPEDIAKLFQLDKVLVGRGQFNTSKKKGQLNLSNAWGNNISLLYQDKFASTKSGTTYGYTAEYGAIQASDWDDKNIGLNGGKMTRVGEQVKEIIAAKALGAFIQNVI